MIFRLSINNAVKKQGSSLFIVQTLKLHLANLFALNLESLMTTKYF